MTLLEKLNQCPPQRCRLLARKHHGHRMMSHTDIANASGLSRRTVIKISKLTTWETVPLRTIERFTAACGINILCPYRRRDQRLIAEGKLSMFRTMSLQQRAMVNRLLSTFSPSQRTNRQPVTGGTVSGDYGSALRPTQRAL